MMLLQSKLLNKHINLIHGFTTRELGGDIARIADSLKISADSLVTIKQSHSNRVLQYPVDVTGRQSGSQSQLEGDALVTHQRGIFLGIRTADCVPILIYDPPHKVMAAIHAGWRGIISGIIENTLARLQDSFKTNNRALFACLGPALCRNCFEVGPEVVSQFSEKFGLRVEITKGRGDRSLVDLRETCLLTLGAAGMPADHVETLSYCTRCRSDLFYSYRRGDRGGRMLSFIGYSPFI